MTWKGFSDMVYFVSRPEPCQDQRLDQSVHAKYTLEAVGD